MSWLPRPIVVLLSLALAAHFVEASSPAGAAEPELTFLAVSAPETDLEKRSIRTAPRVVRRNGDADILQYKVLARTGEVLGGGTFGALHDVYGEVLLDGAKPRLSDNIGFSSLMHRGRRWFALTQFGDLPGALYLSELVQGQDGALIIVETRALETLHIGGLWAPRGGRSHPGTPT